jgi:hypothetical protein
MAAEKAGVPAVSIVATSFLSAGRGVARGLGIANPQFAEYPGPPMMDSDEVLRDKVVNRILPAVLAGWKRAGVHAGAGAAVAEPRSRDIILKGTLDQVQESFYSREWSDGMPIIPPTIARIERFLQFTDRAPDDVIGVCLPDYREATIWNVAVNGVMSGCRPEYMPVLIAVVEALLDPVFCHEHGGSTPGWEPLVIINGPLIKTLDFNCIGGVMRVGRQANTSIGRFVRMFIRNIAGQRIAPTGTDKGCFGMTFNCVLAENEDAVAEVGWQPYSVDRGYARGDNVVTLISVVSPTQRVNTAGQDAENHAQIMAEVLGHAFISGSYNGIRHQLVYPLFVMSPSIAKVLSDRGWNKDTLRQYLYDNVKGRAADIEKYGRNSSMRGYSLKEMVAEGRIPAEYHESDDPNRLVRVFVKPEWIQLVVSGDPGRNQSKAYIQNHRQGIPVSKPIKLPRRWPKLVGNAG